MNVRWIDKEGVRQNVMGLLVVSFAIAPQERYALYQQVVRLSVTRRLSGCEPE